jgi:NitT/TauT family transport system substrate-binding protein
MKRLTTISAAAASGLLSLTLGACGGGSEAASADCDVIRIGTGPGTYGPYLSLFVADTEGYFEDQGVEANLTEYGGGGPAAEAVAAGEADMISWGPIGLAVGQARGLDQVIVAAGMPTSGGWMVLADAESDVQSLEDLDGAKVGIGGPGGTGEHNALWAMNEAGVEWENVSLGYGALNESLQKGTVDAIVQLPPLSYGPVLDGSARVISDLGGEMEPTITDAWVTSNDYRSACADTLQGAIDAISQGTEKLQSDKQFALAKIEEYLGLTGEAAELEYESTIMEISPNGDFKVEWIENAVELAEEAKIAGDLDLPSAEDLYSDEFVNVE